MPKKKSELTFEESLDELDSIVQKMEGEQLPLEELISNYERGALLHQNCETFLHSAKQRLEKIAQSKVTPKPSDQSSSNHDDEIQLF